MTRSTKVVLGVVAGVVSLLGGLLLWVLPTDVDLPETLERVSTPTEEFSSVAPGPSSTRPVPSTTTVPPGPITTVPPDPDPDVLAAALIENERLIRDPSTSPETLTTAAAAQQRAYRTISIHPGALAPVLERMPADLREAVKANADATIELRMLTKPGKALPAWEIITPAPAAELMTYYRQAGQEFGVPWAYMAAIHLVETRMGRIRGTSAAGAQGPMQFLPSTWEAYGEGDINSNRDSIRAAARYLKRNGAPDRMADALFAYNRSDRYVKAVQLHAANMLTDERERPQFGDVPFAYRGYHGWQVWYRLPDGDVLLPEGWKNSA